MKTLVICLDRDDDIGRKAKVKSPVIGRQANLDAAMALGLADPEDSDTNTILGGICEYDKLISEGVDAEIVSLAGSVKVGRTSDRIITEQFEYILGIMSVSSAIVISDGAEDESLMPIIQSRLKVDYVKRIVVKQSENLESTYYLIKQVLNDPKMRSAVFVPIGLASLTYALLSAFNRPELAIAAILGVIGVYSLVKGFGVDEALLETKHNFQMTLKRGRITFVTYLVGAALTLIGTLQGLSYSWDIITVSEVYQSGIVIVLAAYIYASIWWYSAAGILTGVGKLIDLKLEGEYAGRIMTFPFFTLSAGLLAWGVSMYILSSIGAIQGFNISAANSLRYLVISMGVAVIIALIGIRVSKHNMVLDA